MQTPSRPADSSAGSRIAVIDKAVRVLDAVLAAPEGLSPKQVALAVQTNRSTTFRLLTSLEHAGLLTRDASSGNYQLGMKMLQYGSAVRLGLSIVEVAEPILLRLRDDTRQTTLLAVRENWGARCLMRLPGLGVDVVSWTTGQWIPLHIAAAPRALRAAMSDTEVDRYLADYDARPPADDGSTAETVRTDIDAIRRDGCALDTSDAQGLGSFAVVVRDRSDVAVGAIAVTGLANHYTGRVFEATRSAVATAARDIGQHLPDLVRRQDGGSTR